MSNVKKCPFLYHGRNRSFHAVLQYPENTFFDDTPPDRVMNLLGRFLEQLGAAFEMPSMHGALHVPVTCFAQEKPNTVHIEFSSQIDLRAPRHYLDVSGGALDLKDCADGLVTITKYMGPFDWTREHWLDAMFAVSGLDENAGEIKKES